MNWILEHFQVVIILVVVGVTFGGKILEAFKPNRPAGKSILETLGELLDKPAGGDPNKSDPAGPPPLRQAATPPQSRQVTMPADPRAMQAELERQHQMQERLRKIREAKAQPSAAAPAPAPTVVKRQTISRGLKGQLRSGRELRHAVIMREILGPPVGLR